MVRKGWQSVDVPSGWIQVLQGPRPKSVQWPLARDRLQPAPVGVSWRWRQPKSAQGEPPVRPRPRVNPDEKALEAMVDLQGPVVDVLKADLAKARAASKKPTVEAEIGECRKFIRAERRIEELDTEREKERVSLVEAQERLERLVDEQSRCPETPDTLPGSQVTALQQMVNLLQSKRDVLAKELTAARSTISEDQTIHLVVKKQAVSRQASSRRDAHGRIPLMPCHVPYDIGPRRLHTNTAYAHLRGLSRPFC